MTIIKRADLGRPLTWDELDDNFRQVDNLTASASAAVSSASASATAAAGSAALSANSATDAAGSAASSANSATDAANSAANAVQSTLAVLAQDDATKKISTQDGGTVFDHLQAVSVLAFNPPRDGGINPDTMAFKMAIAVAITLGYKKVLVPAGSYWIDEEINLGGVDYYGVLGVRLIGDGKQLTKIFHMPKSDDAACFSIRGGWGSSTARGIEGISVYPANSTYNNKGAHVCVQGASFVDIDSCNIGFGKHGIFLHNRDAGDFTEYVNITRCRLDRNLNDLTMAVDAGDTSFHGVDVDMVQMQLAQGGNGINIYSNSVNRAHPYGCRFNIKFWGRADNDCAAVRMRNTRLDIASGDMTLESGAKFVSEDDSVYHVDGTLKGLVGGSTITFECPSTKPIIGPAHFIFNNRTSSNTLGNFTNPLLSSYRPSVLNPTWAESTDLSAPGFIRIVGNSNTANGVAVVTRNVDTLGYFFGQVTDNEPWRSFSPKFLLNAAGTRLQGYSTTGRMYLSAYKTDDSTVAEVFVGVGRFSPGGNNQYNLGALGTETWNSIFLNASRITDTGYLPTTTNTLVIGQASLMISASYVTKRMYTATVGDFCGTGSPEGVLTAGIGSTYRRTDGGAGTSFYVKETGTGNTGWAAK